PEHRHLVVAEQDVGVRAVAGVTERADTEHAVVDEVAYEECSPLVCGVGFEGLEEALEVAMDVADDQDGQRSGQFRLFGAKRAISMRLMRLFCAKRAESGRAIAAPAMPGSY